MQTWHKVTSLMIAVICATLLCARSEITNVTFAKTLDADLYQGSNVDAEDNLVGEYLFNEGTGNIIFDSSGKGRHGTIFGAQWVTSPILDNSGQTGSALQFNHTYASVPSDALKHLPLSISLWVKPEENMNDVRNNIISNDRPFHSGHGIGINKDGYIYFEYEDAPGTSFRNTSYQVVWGNWYHIVVIYEPSRVSTYVNTKLVDDLTYQQAPLDAEGRFLIGRHNFDSGLGERVHFNGVIDSLRIYHSILSQEKVRALFEVNQECTVAPNGLDTCALKIGDILLQRNPDNFLINQFFMGIGGTYFTHAALYVGNGRIVEARGHDFPSEEQVLEWKLGEDGEAGWFNSNLYDWVVIRPKFGNQVVQSAVQYAKEQAASPTVQYSILVPKDSDDDVYCSQLVWKAYKQAGVDLEEDRGMPSVPALINLLFYVTPDDLFYSAGILSGKSSVVQARSTSISRTAWRWIMWIQSPAHLLLIDPEGRKTGYDPNTQTVQNEIPGVIYSGHEGSAIETLSVTNTNIDGDWRLVITGFDTGDYQIRAGLVDNQTLPPVVLTGNTKPGKQETFIIPNPTRRQSITIIDKFPTFLPILKR